ncbi:precorrin-6A/cobalt-precorrin-6A reductase [Baaleninema simplex]|uniref:precorrin-6A/cobalt-precorrin-6A reductase n=1 Tax=Baaleninema simplex TaxID=2862350 RepID=UPI001FDF8A9C|nr:precorrin-6A/cobalt-precorrin-6A reductase [Baaleninema simplex]
MGSNAIHFTVIVPLGFMIWLIGGTSESRSIALQLSQQGCSWVATVVTPSAVRLYQGLPGQIHFGRLDGMAATTRETGFDRTVLYVISPALEARTEARSQLYSPGHSHLFRPSSPKS